MDNEFTEGNNLTYDKLTQTIKDFKKKDEGFKLDKNWFCPFAEDFNSKYFVSYNCYDRLFKTYNDLVKRSNLIFYNPLSTNDFYRFMGIIISPDTRISNNNFGIWYVDKDDKNKLHPVLYWTGFRNRGDADSSERKSIDSVIDYTLEIYRGIKK